MTGNSSPMNTRDLVVTRVFAAPVELVWKAWTEPEYVMRWWGPDHFTSPSAKMDFREGGTSLVCMRAPQDFGGQDVYSTWVYQKIVPLERIEFIQNLADKDGNQIDPANLGLPPEFPRDTRTIVIFKDLGNGKTEMTVTEYNMPTADTEMGKNAELGLNQSLDKMAVSLGLR
ncbi:MAG: SRPBCC domain-containing protein [Chloroflexota bacterium]|nr:SRPBCC domain-containing protein [Chloroflexota bacterium]